MHSRVFSRVIGAFFCSFVFAFASAQAQEETAKPSPTPIQFSPQTLAECKQLVQAALTSDYAYRQVAHLVEQHRAAPERFPAGAEGGRVCRGRIESDRLEVQLEKVMVPHWVRGEETAALVDWPGKAENTTQKIVLSALGGSVATPPEGITAEVVVVHDFDELKSLGKEKVPGKIVLFTHPFDKADGGGGARRRSLRHAVVYRGDAAERGGAARRGGGADSFGRRRGLSAAAHRRDELCGPTRRRFRRPR